MSQSYILIQRYPPQGIICILHLHPDRRLLHVLSRFQHRGTYLHLPAMPGQAQNILPTCPYRERQTPGPNPFSKPIPTRLDLI